MLLYHGSNITVQNPQIIESDRRLDFGKGFYLTSSFEQASRWAELTVNRRGEGKPVVSVYEFDESQLINLSVLQFNQAQKEWLEYVTLNRKNQNIPNDNYDIVIGPVANDRTMPVISLYFAGIYDIEETLKRLMPQKLHDQYTFKTEAALRTLKFLEVK
ncbi:MAG: DUF3990 domain-containing protein [Treponema sp.]|uniref:DUF3990 domain-containing protein n=1 Tax=Treponema sp. TaxID=166 RepID=UPI00298DA6B7|nr:DUF3990 domain-containing protein [Treponema sp.]MCQ2601967.1 DUF3990 domain-containing protein [Treponema sp.]